MHLKLKRPGWALLICLACWPLGVRCVNGQWPTANVSALKGEMKVFEAVIDGTMAQTFAPPFGLLEKTQGTYLPGFGLAFSLEVNLYPMRVPTPFNMAPLSRAEVEKAQKVKQDRIVTVKESVPRLLADHAMSLRDLGPNDSIAVVVHLFEVRTGESKFPEQIIVEIRKADLEEFWDKKISYQDLLGRMKVLEL
ncbi:MAG: hypothetical protein ABSF46_06785 [Terriglobia bacterium]|jgi:hypothetical protein